MTAPRATAPSDAPARPGPQAPPPRVTIRETGPADLDAVVSLLSERDERPLRRDAVQRNLCGLDPEHLRGWIALVGEEPAGLTTVYTRTMRWGDRTLRAGYWSHLFVREKHRRLMLYPQLVFAMNKGARAAGVDVVFTGTRRPQVAESHLKMGFTQIGAPRVWFRPLRPFRLVTKHKGLPGVVAALGAPADAVWNALSGLRAPRPGTGVDLRLIAPEEPQIDELAILLNRLGEGRISQVWTGDTLRRRLAGALDGGAYTVVGAFRAERLLGAVVVCITTRGAGIRTGVVLDVAASPEDDALRRALLAHAQRRLAGAGAEVALCLEDGAGAMQAHFRALGWRRSGETYHMVIWPKDAAHPTSPAADFAAWRFTFLDHDAF